MNFKNELKKYQEKVSKASYADDTEINNELSKIAEEVTADEILSLYKQYKVECLKNQNIAKETRSDFFYWGYVSKWCTYEYLYKLMAQIYKGQIEEDDYGDIVSLKKKANGYQSILDKIKEKKQGLEEYKPASYKSKIELLESLIKED